MSFMRSIKRSFWRGVAALLPALLTVIVLVLGISFVHNYIGRHVNNAIVQVLAWSAGWSVKEAGTWYDAHLLGWLGVVVAIIGLCVAAYFLGTFIGGRILRLVESWLVRLPILRKIYPGAKQVSEFFFSEKSVEFRRVVAIQYPRLGLWSIGFVTGRSFRAVAEAAGREMLSVFIPTTPTPVTGFIVTVPREEVTDLPLTVDEAFQYIISAGVILPPAERLASLEVARLVQTEEEAAAELKGGLGAGRPPTAGGGPPAAPPPAQP
ncbi:MAG: DUF502 domain-containing protein [Planctomycetes bacterium]|nr:DUF502 domain-containing protein [Planctomycetota bacterium]